MSHYHHLSIEERESLMLIHERGGSIRQIARELGRAPSTISRELRRNAAPYRASSADKRYRCNREKCVRRQVLDNKELKREVHILLSRLYWSPEEISMRMKLEGTGKISAGTVYRALDTGKLRDTLRYYLRLKHRTIGKASKKSKACFQKSISQRPVEAQLRSEPGHWEGDTIRGSGESACLVTLVDRYSRYLLCSKVSTKESAVVRQAVVELLKNAGLPVKSITFDQGTEFSEGVQLENELGIDVYFAHPHSPWERPTNENTNGLIRQFVPKRSKISSLTPQEVSSFTNLLNFRPRKCLGFLTPFEVAFSHLLHLT